MVLQPTPEVQSRPANNYLWIYYKLNIFISCADHLLRSPYCLHFMSSTVLGYLAVLRSYSPELLTKDKDINQSVIRINLNDQESPPWVRLLSCLSHSLPPSQSANLRHHTLHSKATLSFMKSLIRSFTVRKWLVIVLSFGRISTNKWLFNCWVR